LGYWDGMRGGAAANVTTPGAAPLPVTIRTFTLVLVLLLVLVLALKAS